MVNFENGVTPINDTNLNKMQTDLQQADKDLQANINKLKGTALYEDETGTTGNITLNDEIENYNYYEIESYVGYSSANVYTTTGKLPVATKSRIHINNLFIGTTGVQIYCKRVSISGTVLSVISDRTYSSAVTDGSYTYITKVIGYKEA